MVFLLGVPRLECVCEGMLGFMKQEQWGEQRELGSEIRVTGFIGAARTMAGLRVLI